jgi:hypothetical protein
MWCSTFSTGKPITPFFANPVPAQAACPCFGRNLGNEDQEITQATNYVLVQK